MSSARLRVSAVRYWDSRGRGAVHGGGPLPSLQHNRMPKERNPVNHPFGVGEMAENCLQANPLGVVSGLDQAPANGVANQTCCFMDV